MSLISSALVNFAMLIWLSLETGSAEVLAYAAIAGFLPQSIIGLFAGVYVDRWDRKKTMMLADGFIALCTIVIAYLFYTGEVELWYIYLLLGFRAIGSAFHMPAMQASIPLLAPENQLLRIAGVNQALQSVSNIAGPALAALAITLLDIEYVLLLDVIGAVFAITSLCFVHIPNPKRNPTEKQGVSQILHELWEAVQSVYAKKGLPLIFLFSIICTFFIMPVAVLFPLFTLQHFQGSTYQMSLVEVVWGAGMLAGGALLSILKIRANKVLIINWTYVVLGICFIASGLLPYWAFILFVLLTAVGGICTSVYNANFTTILQENINPALLGRVFSVFFSVSLLPAIIGLLGTGYIADYIGISRAFVIMGGLILLLGILSFCFPKMIQVGKGKK